MEDFNLSAIHDFARKASPATNTALIAEEEINSKKLITFLSDTGEKLR
jgi:hypothetical protein